MDGDPDGGYTQPVSVSTASLENMDSSIVSEDNLNEQRDELLAIQSIFDDGDEERITVISEPDEKGQGLFRIQIKIPVVMPYEECQIDLMLPTSEDSSPAQSGKQSPMGAEGGEGVGEGPEEGGGAQGLGEGATASTPPPDLGKGVALQRSLSGQRWTGSVKVQYLHPLSLHLTLPPNYPSEVAPSFVLSCTWLRGPQLSALCRQLDDLWEASPNMPIVFTWIDWLEKESFSCLGLTDKLVLVPEGEDGESEDVDDRAMSECTDIGLAVHTLLQYSNQKEAVEFCKSMQECCLCFDEKPGTKFFRLEPCKHHFCFDCITTHCNMHVTDGTIQLLTCPYSECETVITPDVLQNVLTTENFIRWEMLSLQRSLDQMEDVVYCPRCQAVVIREQDASLNLAYCMACCYSFCTECEQPWHQGTQCTTDLERLDQQARRQNLDQRARDRYEDLRRQAEEKAKTLIELKAKTVPCPHCKALVEKIEGCNKMTCRCGKFFCWMCGKGITGYSHFTEKSCVLFRYNPEPVTRVIQRQRPPDALLWMQAQAELQGGGMDQSIRCLNCKQLNFKLNRNNHIRCWNCKVNNCFYCRSRITGVVTQHFIAGGCPQHS
ncbi:E3 ubiquitin-protein ligase RNF14-like [Babylonia areolata]|uniref:E3 ubiquitin-protein ligase RNF14-like n=1 Tax=Babylonia areolata TaxID=304850 RepID=UPI003FD51400